MRIALQLHKADPKYAELEVALEMVSAVSLSLRCADPLLGFQAAGHDARPP
jgi:hypothetical protein